MFSIDGHWVYYVTLRIFLQVNLFVCHLHRFSSWTRVSAMNSVDGSKDALLFRRLRRCVSG